ncbi:MAG: thiamine-phosphate kinase [Actinomycetes bacterium]
MSEQSVGELGEFALIDAIAARLAKSSAETVSVGIGDDSAVVSAKGGNVVACLDMLTQGVHFRLDWSEAIDIGRKAAAQNLADIFAMGARPTALLVGLALPPETPVAWVMGLADGLSAEAAEVGVTVVGGDIVRSSSIVISVTALGELGTAKAILRSGAKPGDTLAIAGRLGFAQAGLLMLSRGFRSPRILVGAHRVPEPPYELAKLATHATSMIDISDGLVSDLGHIAQASKVKINIESNKFQIPEALAAAASAFNGDAMEWILSGGEDHAFAATFKTALDVPSGWTIIGSVDSGEPVVTVDGESYSGKGWDHFSTN